MMFTEGLDENAINWVKQRADSEKEVRSPLSEKLSDDPIPRSPLRHRTSNYISPHALPPLKFYSGLLGPHHVPTLNLHDALNDDSSEYDEDEDESVASVPDDLQSNYSEDEVCQHSDFDYLEKTSHGYADETIGLQASSKDGNSSSVAFNEQGGSGTLINRGVSKMHLKVEVPHHVRRFSNISQQYTTPNTGSQCSAKTNRSSTQDTPILTSRYYDAVDQTGTPSAPPVHDSGKVGNWGEVDNNQGTVSDVLRGEISDGRVHMPGEEECQIESDPLAVDDRQKDNIFAEVETKTSYWASDSLDPLPCHTSGQNAWQTLVAYEACIRLCLLAWAKGCPDAPEFLRDECLILRRAFGLHNFLLQPRRTKAVGVGATKSFDQASSSVKPKKVVGRIRVEVKKLRIIPRRKMKSSDSYRAGLYVQTGADYCRQVSSYVKSGINSIMSSPLLVNCEESHTCLLLLKSSAEVAELDSGSAICLRPGTGEYQDLFPENQKDALVVEVQDTKQTIQGRTVIPVSSVTENPNDKIRWWPLYHDEQCIGKIQLFISSTITNEDDSHIKSAQVVETLAYDLLLEAAMRAEHFHSRNLRLHGPWRWLLAEFSDYYGVSDCYTKLRYLSYSMNVATPTKDCLELLQDLLVPIIKARSESRLNRQEKGIFLECETQIESLLANVFENYKSLDEHSSTGLSDSLIPITESAAPALAPAVQVYTLLHDILAQDAQTVLQNYLQTAAKKRCRKHMLETDEFMSTNLENVLVDPMSISTAYLKMKNLCMNLRNEVHADIKIHNQHILPSCIDLSNIAATVYSTELCKRIRRFLSTCPPSSPLPHVNELLIAAADFERDLESWNLSPIQGGMDSKNLFNHYIMVWVQEMQLSLLELCKAEKVPWAGVLTVHSTSPFAESMYSKLKDALTQYEVVISRWPQYCLVLENAAADVERAIIKALEKQYSEILMPLKDSIPKKLGMQVQKLARRQSTMLYSAPNQLGTFLNTVKRILDFLHCKVEDILKAWAQCLPIIGDKKSCFGEQMNGVTVLLRTKYKTYMQAIVTKLYANMQASRNTQLKRILEETEDSDGEAEVRERMQILSSQLSDSILNLHEVFSSQIFIALCRGFWDRTGQTVLKFLEGRKENRVWYKGSYYALGILDDTFASQMQCLQGNALQEKDLEPPRSVVEARAILCRDATNGTDQSTYFYF